MKWAELAGQPVRKGACGPSGKDVGQYRRVRTRLPQRVTIERRDRRLRTEKVSGPDLDPRRAEREALGESRLARVGKVSVEPLSYPHNLLNSEAVAGGWFGAHVGCQ
jgi:hypothetical protein